MDKLNNLKKNLLQQGKNDILQNLFFGVNLLQNEEEQGDLAQQQKPKRLILADQPLMIAPPNLAFNFNPLPLTQFIDYQH